MWNHLSSVHPVIAPVAPDTSAQRQREIAVELATLSAELALLVGPPLPQPIVEPLPEAPLSPLHYIDHACPLDFFRAGDIPPCYGVATEVICDACNQACVTSPFYHCDDCQFDVCLPCFVEGAARAFMQRMAL
jgi:hypothetical protein